MRIEPRVIIFSVFEENLSRLTNLRTHGNVASKLERLDIAFKQVDGIYKGNSELSFVVSAEHEEYVRNLCKHHNQECYLLSESDRASFLVNPLDGSKHPIGTLKAISKDVAQGLEAYTYCPTTGLYYAAL